MFTPSVKLLPLLTQMDGLFKWWTVPRAGPRSKESLLVTRGREGGAEVRPSGMACQDGRFSEWDSLETLRCFRKKEAFRRSVRPEAGRHRPVARATQIW